MNQRRIDLNRFYKGKKIMITGGTGSLGKTLVNNLLKYNPKEIRIFSRDELKQSIMREIYINQKNVTFRIGDVKDINSIREALESIDIVFHAAALKQVPTCEYFPFESVKTNIIGTKNVVDACLGAGIKYLMAVSTDKACAPINTYGMSKGIMEQIIITANQRDAVSGKIYSCIRYGNVIGSRGSAIPIFRERILKGEEVYLTHKDMTRFFVQLKFAAQKIIEALPIAYGGEIFILDIKAIKISDLIDSMYETLTPEKPKKIKLVGIRPGEKIHESLISVEESARTVKINGYFVLLPRIELNIFKKYDKLKKIETNEFSSKNAEYFKKSEIIKTLKEEGWLNSNFVPEYNS
ncbi:MAG TPA: polysaccharide biosynthesis protein [bacterium]|nr:polysaccharide biosynthesis protein [bacterium]